MDRTLHARRVISGDPARLRETLIQHTPELLQTASGDDVTAPGGDGSFLMTLHTRAVGVDARKQVRVRLGEVREGETWLRIPVRWEAEPGRRMFPSFDGGIEFEQIDRLRVEMVLFGRYDPPLGPLGGAGDLLLGNLPHEAGTRLLDRLARALVDAVYGGEAPAQPPSQPGSVPVSAVMTTAVLTLTEEDSLRDAAQRLLTAGISGAPVVDASGEVIGVISQRDLLDKVAEPPSGFSKASARAQVRNEAWTVGGACSRPARTTEADSTVRDAATEMARAGVDRLVVMDGAKVVGIVTSTDVLEVLVRSDDAILQGVQALLLGVDEPELDVAVADGVVTFRGRVEARSTAESLHHRVSTMSGVIRVITDHLDWREDDTIIPPMPLT